MRCLFPRRAPGRLDAMLMNTAGGLTGGDAFSLTAEALPGSHLSLTTQTAERIYSALPGMRADVRSGLKIGEDARLDWMPQETILFDSAVLERRMTVSVAPSGRFLFVEPLLFGRTARTEELRAASLTDRFAIDRDGVPLWRDGIDLAGDISAHLDRAAVARGARALATVLLLSPDAESHLAPIRRLLPETAGASLPRPDLLVLRLLAPDGFELRRVLLPVLDRLTGGDLPKTWRPQ